ncbi:hypothetical protein CBR_g41343 [Chara braunii]|uniref:Integrase catalytic domain-containing protein n=1 Tax=Chara braunii TaxID=69332 RepID=A0A388LVK3_CHABU|nr:hypothetical protein CBR_g41343 [Chara braunii]|eukprot:GBG86348.1 hypothetical protein CBR_g41343 [Chara braunii]
MLDDENSLMWHIKPKCNRILLLVVLRQRPVIIIAHQVTGEKSVVGGSIYEVLLTDYLRCLPTVRTKLVDEACVEQHNFASFSKKALDTEAKLGSAHQASQDGRKRLPQDWKKKGQLMFVDHDGQTTEIDNFPDLGEFTEQDGASETSNGGVVAPIKEKARGTGKKKVGRSTGQDDQGTPAWVKIGLDYEVWRDRVARGTCMNRGNYGHTSRTCRDKKITMKMKAITNEREGNIEAVAGGNLKAEKILGLLVEFGSCEKLTLSTREFLKDYDVFGSDKQKLKERVWNPLREEEGWDDIAEGKVESVGTIVLSEQGWHLFCTTLAAGQNPMWLFGDAEARTRKAGEKFANKGWDEGTTKSKMAMRRARMLRRPMHPRPPTESGGGWEVSLPASYVIQGLDTEWRAVTLGRGQAFMMVECLWDGMRIDRGTGDDLYTDLKVTGTVYLPEIGWLGKEMATEEGIDDQQSGGNQGTNGDGERNEGPTRDRESTKLEGTQEDGKDFSTGESSGKPGGSIRGPQENKEGGNDMRTRPRNSAGVTPKKTKVSDTSRKLADIENRTAKFKARLIEQMMAEDEEDPQGAGSHEGRRAGQDEPRYEGKDNSRKETPSKKGNDKNDPPVEGAENAMTPLAIDSGTSQLPATPKVTGACDGLWSLRKRVLGWFDPEGTPKTREKQRESKEGEGTSAAGEAGSSEGGLKRIVTTLTRALNKNQGYLADAKKKLTFDGANITEFLIDYENLAALLKWTEEEKMEHLGQHVLLSLGRDMMVIVARSLKGEILGPKGERVNWNSPGGMRRAVILLNNLEIAVVEAEPIAEIVWDQQRGRGPQANFILESNGQDRVNITTRRAGAEKKLIRDTVMEEAAGASADQEEAEAEEQEKVYGKTREEEPVDKVTAAKKKFSYQIPVLTLPELDDTLSKLLGTMVSVSFQTMLQASPRLLKGLRQLLTRKRVEVEEAPEPQEQGPEETEAPQGVSNLQSIPGGLEELEKAFADIRLSLPDREGGEHECWNDKGPAYEFGIAAEVTDLLRAKIDSFVAEPTASPYANKWFVFRKPNKTLRWIQDLQKLNAVTIRDAGSLPQADLLAESHAGRSIYSLVDLYSGYDQLPLEARDRPYTAMHTPVGQLEMQVTPMGFTNAVAEAQRRMLAVIGDMFPEKCEPYIDDNPVKGARYKDETKVEPDGGPMAVGGVLIQKSEEGEERPIRFESRTLNSAERRYSQFKKEVLAILHCLKTFQAYLFGRQFILRIDPTNVAGALKNYKPIDPTVGRWIGFIWQFDYKVERIAGLRNRADGLSRVCITPKGIEDAEPIDAFLDYGGGPLVVENEMADATLTKGQLLIHTLEKGTPAVVAELREGPVTTVRRKEEKDSWGAEVGAKEELMAMAVEGGRDAVMTLAEIWAQKECQYLVNQTREEQGTDQKEQEFFLIQMYEGVFREIGLVLVGNKQPTEVSPKAREEVEKYDLRNGHLFKKEEGKVARRVVCGRSRQLDVIQAMHDGLAGGHRSSKGTLAKIVPRYFWPRMAGMVATYCQTCLICQERSFVRIYEPLRPTRVLEPGHLVHLDLAVMPVSTDGFRYILDTRDNLSGYVEAVALKRKTAKAVADWVEDFYLRHPFVRRFIADNGT